MTKPKKKPKETTSIVESNEKKTGNKARQVEEEVKEATTEGVTDTSFTTDASSTDILEQQTENIQEEDSGNEESARGTTKEDTRQRANGMRPNGSREEDFPPLSSNEGGNVEKPSLTARLQEAERKVLKGIIQIMSECNNDPRLSALVQNVLDESLNMKDICFEAITENAQLKGEVAGLKDVIPKSNFERGEGYRDALLKEQVQEKVQKKERQTEALIINSENHKHEEVKKMVCRKVDPSQLGLTDVQVRINQRGVVVTSTSREGLEKLKKLINSDKDMCELKTKEPKKKLPEIKVVGIEEDINDEEIVNKIITQNNLNVDQEDLELVRTWKGKIGKSAVIRVSKEAFKLLDGKKHISIGWTKCAVYDNTFVPRCVRCAQFGHTERFCDVKDQDVRCVRCGRRHYYRACKEEEACIACLQEPYAEVEDANHSFMWNYCPQYLFRKARELERIMVRLS